MMVALQQMCIYSCKCILNVMYVNVFLNILRGEFILFIFLEAWTTNLELHIMFLFSEFESILNPTNLYYATLLILLRSVTSFC